MKRKPEREFSFAAAAFNLITETGDDPLRVALDRLHAAELAAAAREYELKMQRVFADCPGFLAADVPTNEKSRGHVTIDPVKMTEALRWLKRRFIVNESLEADLGANGLRVELMPRPARAASTGTRKPAKALFAKPEQFTLSL